MPIEFNCGQCGQRLRVPDTSAGKKAKCPKCEQVLNVPDSAASAAPPAAEGAAANPFSAPPAGDSLNPYESPTSAFESSATAPTGPVSTGTLDAGFALSTAWEMFKPNIALLAGAVAVQFVISIVMSSGLNILQMLLMQTSAPDSPEVIGFQVISFIVQQVVNTFLVIGIIRLCLGVARNQNPEFSELFSGGKYFLRVLGGNIVYFVMISIGLLLLVIPGIYLAIKYLPFSYCIVDRDCSIGEGFKIAGEITDGNKLQVLLMGIIAMGLGILGILMLCVGLIPTTAVANLMYTVGYLMMSSQPLMRPNANQAV